MPQGDRAKGRRLKVKRGYAYAAITGVLFSLLEPISKIIADDVDAFSITVIRFFIGAICLLPSTAIALRKNPASIKKKDLVLLSITGIIMVALCMPCLQIAVQTADSPATIAIVFSGNSLFTILLSALFLHERIRPLQAAAIVLCAVGIAICGYPMAPQNVKSIGMALLAACLFSLYTVITKKYLVHVNSAISISLSFLLGSVVLLLIMSCTRSFSQIAITPRVAICITILGVAVTGAGYLAYFAAIKNGGASTAAFAFFIKPILAPLTVFLINGAVPTRSVFFAIPFVLLGLALSSYSVRRQEPAWRKTDPESS